MTGGILALDVATISGWAYGLPGERPRWGSWRAGRVGAAPGEILALFHDWLEARVAEHQPGWLIFEAPYVPNVTPKQVRTASGHKVWTARTKGTPIDIKVLRRLIAMCGLVELVAHRHRIQVREELPNVITKSFTGHGNWGGREDKKLATIKMCEVYGWAVSDDNQADALALWVHGEAVLYSQIAAKRRAGPLFARAV